MPRSDNKHFLDKISYLIVDTIVPYLIKLNIHPNIITLFGFIPIYLIYINILANNIILTYLFAFTNYTLDCLDGELARKSGKTSKLGGILDTIHDLTSFITIIYLILGFKSIYLIAIGTIVYCYIFKFDLIAHEVQRFKKINLFLLNYLDILYYLLITFVLIYLH